MLEVSAGEHTTPRSTGDTATKNGYTSHTFDFSPGVVVDRPRYAVYVMSPHHAIDAVNLSTGKLIWTTTQAAKPLLVYGHLLVAAAEPGERGALRIVVLNTRNNGGRELDAEVKLPPGVVASIDDGLGTSFQTSARIDGGSLIVSWSFSKQRIDGANREATMPSQIAGAARIDLKTGRVEALKGGELPSLSRAALPANVAHMVAAGVLTGPIWHVDGVVATLQHEGGTGGRRTILRRWRLDAGEPLPDVVLFGRELTLRYPSADGRHLLASTLVDPGPPGKYVWVIFSLETGARAAEVRRDSPAARFFIAGSHLIHESPLERRLVAGQSVEEPRKLRAIDLEGGAELWSWPIRNTAYHGPYPPAGTGGRGTLRP